MATMNAVNLRSYAFEATTGDITITTANLVMPATTSATAGAITFGGSVSLAFKGTGNVFLGVEACNLVNTIGSYNLAAGYRSLTGMNGNYSNNTACGAYAMYAGANAGNNTAVGYYALGALNGGSGSNVAIGYNSGYQLVNGTSNTFLGYESGSAYTGAESSNITIGNTGTAGESNVIRIGTPGSGTGQQNKCYIAGIYGISVGATAGVVICDSNSQLGTLAGTSGQLLMGGTAPAYSTATYPVSVSQGNLLYASAADTISGLAKNTSATRYLANTGTNNNPAWAQVDLSNGVTGTLPVTNGGRIQYSTQSASYNVAVNTSVIVSSGSSVTATMPATAAQGSMFNFVRAGSGALIIQLQTGQVINYGASPTSSGGTLTSGAQYDCVSLVCITANTTFVARSWVGTWTPA